MRNAEGEAGVDASRWRVPDWLDHGAGWAWRLLLLAAGLYVAVWSFGLLRLVLLPLLVGLLLAALAAPLAQRLARRVPNLVAAWAVFLLVVLTLGGVVGVTATAVGRELSNNTQWAEVETEVRQWLQGSPFNLSEDEVDDLQRDVEDAVAGGVRNVGFGRVRLVVDLFSGAFLSAVLFFFFIKDGPELWRWLVERAQPQRQDAIDQAGRAAFDSLQGYVRGIAITGVVDGVAIGLALWIIGVPLVIPLAVLTFVGAFFPIVGATVAGALATVVALVANGPVDAALVALTTLAIQQLEGDLIMPMVMRRRVGLHPAVILVALAAGGALAGVTGAFVAVPVAAMTTAAAASFRDD